MQRLRFLFRRPLFAPLAILTSSLSLYALTTTTIDVPGATDTGAVGINAQGDIVGFYTAGGIIHGFLFRGGSYSTIDVPGAQPPTVPLGINAQGDIVGFYGGFTNEHGFLLRNGAITRIDVP